MCIAHKCEKDINTHIDQLKLICRRRRIFFPAILVS